MSAADRWQRARDLFHACIDLDPTAQAALLARECAEDSALESEVKSLLASAAASKTFMEVPAASLLPGEDLTWIGRTLGAYRIVSLLAVGGMGEVYRAVRVDGLYSHDVAIKLIRRELAGQVMLSRFRAEREILAALQHPNIARILDAGVTDAGLPYIVMEMIDGEPIDGYCEHHGLSLRQRLKLFIEVCAAVHFAHQHLTVHRDLKPGNILVTHQGVVKLLDFGIAKVLDAESPMPALTALHAMTPEYSSPEQIRREPITTATDIYSLGVILYRLLTGRSPYRSTGDDPYALAREVCDTQPLKPSANLAPAAGVSARKQLGGDLDSIVLMALRKERDKRYESAQQFADDVQRYLDNRTVAARPRTWRYSASRFIARNRAVSLATALLFLVLIAGILATTREARIAAAERDRAQRHFDSVRQLANSFMFDIHDEISKLPGSIKARQLLVNKALTYLDLLAQEPGGDAALQLELAEAYMRVGSVQGQVGYNNLGDHAAARQSYQKGIALLEQALRPDPAARAESVKLSRAYNLASANLNALGKPTEELAMISKEIDLMQRRLARVPDSLEVRTRLGDALYRRSQFRMGHGDLPGASDDAQRTVDFYEQAVAKDPQIRNRNNLAFAYSNFGAIQLQKSDAPSHAQGIESLRKALSVTQILAAEQKSDINIQRHQAVSAAELGAALVTLGQPREGLPYAEESSPIFQALFDADKSNRLARLDLVEAKTNSGNLWVSLGDPVKALDHFRGAADLLKPPPNPPDSDLEWSGAFIEAHTNLAAAAAGVAEAAGVAPQRRLQLWREVRQSAAAALQTAQALVASRPQIAPDYAGFIAKDQALEKRATQE